MKQKTIGLIVTLITILAMLMTGCASTGDSTQESTTATDTSTSAEDSSGDTDASTELDLSGVTLRVNGFSTTGLLLEAAGVADTPYQLDIGIYAGGNLALQAMAADELDLANTSEIPPLFASLAETGGNFKIVATSEGNALLQDLIVGPQSTIQSVAELAGQTVGYVQSTTAQYFLIKMLEEAGLTWDDIDPVSLSPSDGLAALLSGDIAAFAVYGNQITANLEQGGRVLASGKDILSGNYVYCASELALEDEAVSAAIVDFLGRVELANEWIRNNYEEYAALVADAYGMTEEDYVAYLKDGDAQRVTHIRAFSDSDVASLQDVADAFYSVGLLETEIDAASLYSDVLSQQITETINPD